MERTRTEEELAKRLIAALLKCGFKKSQIRRNYEIWIGNEFPYSLDVVLMTDDGDDVICAFEIKSTLDGIRGVEAARRILDICRGGFPCYLVDGSKGNGRIAEVVAPVVSSLDLVWGGLDDHKGMLGLLQRVCNAQQEICAPVENVEGYLRAISRRILDLRHSHAGPVDNQCIKFLFRGHPNDRWKLCPALFRDVEKGKRYPKDLKMRSYLSEEQYLLDEAERMFPDLFRVCRTDVERMSIAQHYEIPTRLLDVSDNALVALYFATQKMAKGKDRDGRVFVFKVSASEYRQALKMGRCESDLCWRHGDECEQGERGSFGTAPQLVFPSFLTQRQRAQSGAFYVMGDDGAKRIDFKKDDYSEITIPKGRKAAILEELEERCNIHKGTLFPESLTSYKEKLLREASVRIRKAGIK